MHVASEVDVITNGDPLRIPESGHDEQTLRGGGSPLTGPFR